MRRLDRFKYRYCIDILDPIDTAAAVRLHHSKPGEPVSLDGTSTLSPRYTVARWTVGGPRTQDITGQGGGRKEGEKQFLAPCGRFVCTQHGYNRVFASDREADRMVERLASGMPVFITRAAAIAGTLGVVVPAWLAALT